MFVTDREYDTVIQRDDSKGEQGKWSPFGPLAGSEQRGGGGEKRF